MTNVKINHIHGSLRSECEQIEYSSIFPIWFRSAEIFSSVSIFVTMTRLLSFLFFAMSFLLFSVSFLISLLLFFYDVHGRKVIPSQSSLVTMTLFFSFFCDLELRL